METNKYNLKVGDLYGYSEKQSKDWEITSINKNSIGFTTGKDNIYSGSNYTGKEQGTINRKEFETSLNKGERVLNKSQDIIGYELLKELPGIPQGTTTHEINLNPSGWNFKQYFFNTEQIKDRNWFKPIYESTTLRVDISDDEDGTKRIVEITEDKIILNSGIEFMTKIDFLGFVKHLEHLNTEKQIGTGRKHYSFEILKFKIGCQFFTREDVEVIYKALNSN